MPRAADRPAGRIFLLSHMRAYTSLVGHLLGSHPEIDGYYEMHLGYASPADLETQRQRYCEHDRLKPGSCYLFDKLLHNDYPLALDYLDATPLVVLTSLRPPAPTLRSIVDLFARKPGRDPYADPAGAAAYYIARLRTLAAFAERHAGRFHYFDAPLVLDDSARLLDTLGTWLQLGSPLAQHYRTFARTGEAGAGDSSPAIASGRIVRAPIRSAQPALDAALLQQAQAAYADCRARLITHAAAALTG
ncbi:MAG: hypothetical protein BGP21_05740 [Thiobacillus sp. 65-29]|nr:MAG: hypothetical protein BGP21_05740 [Thiobacillus sp. 65-29]